MPARAKKSFFADSYPSSVPPPSYDFTRRSLETPFDHCTRPPHGCIAPTSPGVCRDRLLSPWTASFPVGTRPPRGCIAPTITPTLPRTRRDSSFSRGHPPTLKPYPPCPEPEAGSSPVGQSPSPMDSALFPWDRFLFPITPGPPSRACSTRRPDDYLRPPG